MKLADFDWYCDNCDAYLSAQDGFDADCGCWACTECGHENTIAESEIIGYDDDEDDEDSGEGLDVYDAALIWLSNGCDEDYTFGYDEDELRQALS